MTKKEVKNTILRHKDILNKYSVDTIALFGSFVRNQQDKGSDVDLLVEFKNPTFNNYIESMQILVEIGNSLRIYSSSIFRGSNMYPRREFVACSVS
jgi:predicted nucleotidyltransferase